MLLRCIGYLFILGALFVVYLKFFVAKSRCAGGAALLDGLIMPPLLFTAGFWLLTREQNHLRWFYGAVFLAAFVVVAFILIIGWKIGANPRR